MDGQDGQDFGVSVGVTVVWGVLALPSFRPGSPHPDPLPRGERGGSVVWVVVRRVGVG